LLDPPTLNSRAELQYVLFRISTVFVIVLEEAGEPHETLLLEREDIEVGMVWPDALEAPGPSSLEEGTKPVVPLG